MKLRTRAPSVERPTSTASQSSRGAQTPIATKPTGLRRILSKMRRSNSVHSLASEAEVREPPPGWDGHRTSVVFSPNTRLEDWDTDMVCTWFDSLGLYMYSNEVRKHVKSGRQLCQLSSTDLEAKLGIKHVLHRKKVCLALLARQQGSADPAGLLDHQWVTRWLDDVGLPQYKDSFLEAR